MALVLGKRKDIPKDVQMTLQPSRHGKIRKCVQVFLTDITDTRVQGCIRRTAGPKRTTFCTFRYFDVKHDGLKFAVGSDSGKQIYYFRDQV